MLYARDGCPHLVHRVATAHVVLAREGADVAVQMLRADLVVDADVGALQHAPEALYAVGVDLPSDVFSGAVVDRLMMPVKPLVGFGVVSEDVGVWHRGVVNEVVRRLLVGELDHEGADVVGVAVLGSDDGRLADRSAPGQFLALGLGHVLALAAHVGFIDLDRPREVGALVVCPNLADAVQHEPGGFLCDAYVPVQLH